MTVKKRSSVKRSISQQSAEHLQPTRRVNFDLAIDQHTKLKIYAARRKKSIKEVLTGFIQTLPRD